MSDGFFTDAHPDDRRPSVFSRGGPCTRSGMRPYFDRVRAVLESERLAHVMRVAELAETIGCANAFDERDLHATCLAAILHDVARDMPDEQLLELAPPENDMERANPIALHGRAGRAVARAWGVTDERVLDAIEDHVLGPRPGDRVGMAIYVADISEPGRGVNADIRELAMRDLDRAYRCAVEAKVAYLRRCGKDVHPRTLKVHDELAHAP